MKDIKTIKTEIIEVLAKKTGIVPLKITMRHTYRGTYPVLDKDSAISSDEFFGTLKRANIVNEEGIIIGYLHEKYIPSMLAHDEMAAVIRTALSEFNLSKPDYVNLHSSGNISYKWFGITTIKKGAITSKLKEIGVVAEVKHTSGKQSRTCCGSFIINMKNVLTGPGVKRNLLWKKECALWAIKTLLEFPL